MREIKFRVWDKGFMDEDVLVDSRGAFGDPEKHYNTPNIEIEPYSENAVIMQYTGLKDKNDKEVYEADVIEYQGYPTNPDYRERRLVKWVKGGFIIKHIWSNDKMPHESEYMMQLWYATIPERYVVIGNIYQTPELLQNLK